MDLKLAQEVIKVEQFSARLDELSGKAMTRDQRMAVLQNRATLMESRIDIHLRAAKGGSEGKVFDGT
jgi:hypothetical protein